MEIPIDVPENELTRALQLIRDRRPQSRTGKTKEEFESTLSRPDIYAALAQLNGMIYLPRVQPLINQEAISHFEPQILRKGIFVPIQITERQITLVVANPYLRLAQDYCSQQYGNTREVVIAMGNPQEIISYVDGIGSDGPSNEQIRGDIDSDDEGQKERIFDLTTDYSVAQRSLLRAIFQHALKLNASDVHFKMDDEEFYVDYRVDGVMGNYFREPERKLEDRLRPIIDSLLLTLSGNKEEDGIKKPLVDGRFSLKRSGGGLVEVRYVRHWCVGGWRAVCRLQDKILINPTLGSEHMEFTPPSVTFLKKAAKIRSGIFVISGPTGAGKSTTLEAMIRYIHDDGHNFMTMENPVEMRIKGAIQCDIRKHENFPEFMKAGLRADPDRFMIQEIRDLRSAELVIEAALTGHPVFTTLHANNAIQCIDRLRQINIEPWKIAATLRAVSAQRLVKCLCPHCRIGPRALTPEDFQTYDRLPEDLMGKPVYNRNPQGCSNCRGKGYASGSSGRRAIIEALPITEDAAIAIVGNVPTIEIERMIRSTEKLPTLFESGLDLLTRGITDLAALDDAIELVSLTAKK